MEHAGPADRIGLVPLDVRSADEERAARRWIEVFEAAERAEFGERALSLTLAEARALAADPDTGTVNLAAMVGDRVVGAVTARIPLRDNRHRLDFDLAVHPECRRRGIGSALIEESERIARAHGRTVVGSESQRPLGQPGAATAAFAAKHGYTCALVELRSELEVTPDLADRLSSVDHEVAPHLAGYAVESVVGALPMSWLADRAELERALSVDIPLGEVDAEEEVWDADRMARAVQTHLATGCPRLESVARHLGSGRLVAFTAIQGPAADGRGPAAGAAYQWATLVLDEHRGHRLGLAIKSANLRLLLREQPAVRRVCTWNAEDNEPMLRVNRSLGFQPVGRLTEWQKELAARP